MSKKHTPAPWSCSNEGWGDYMADVRGPNGEGVCRIAIYNQCPSGDGEAIVNENYDPDRALILAAPDLLAALEKVAMRLDGCLDDRRAMGSGSMTNLLEICSEAIAVAKGDKS